MPLIDILVVDSDAQNCINKFDGWLIILKYTFERDCWFSRFNACTLCSSKVYTLIYI